ncbi:MAG: amidase [Candidatus Caldarchaeum sp.]|nr:amidase [Candidatus Caldarchaeum sp.]
MTTPPFEQPLCNLLMSAEYNPAERWSKQLETIRRLNPKHNAYITVFDKPVVRKDHRRRALKGLTVAVKDVFDVRGFPTTAGSKLLAHHIPDDNANAVDILLSNGAALNGKTNLHEFAFGVSNINPHYGPCLNPYDTSRVSGGSSGGSAVAVALGMCDVGLGTDTAGSVRIPASFCGVVGFKPSQGLVSLAGVVPLSWSLDHIGILSRSVWENALVFSVLVDGVSRGFSLRAAKLEGVSVGVPANFFLDYLEKGVRSCFEDALKRLESEGAEIRFVQIEDVEKAVKCRTIIGFAESAAYHLKLCRGRLDLYGEDVRQRIVRGFAIPAVSYVTALRARKKLTARFRKIFQKVDVLATPTTIITAHRLDEEEVSVEGKTFTIRAATLRNTEVFNLYGVPAISVPMGFSATGLPTGLQLIADHGQDKKLLKTAYAVEKLFTTSS